MDKSFKGLIAAAAGTAVLLGGAGSLAYWTDVEDVGGTAVNGGSLAIVTDATNAGCDVWQLDHGESAPGAYAAGDPLVPGDTLSRECRYTVHATGNHLRATIGVSTPSMSGSDMGGSLHAAVSGLVVGGAPATAITESDDGAALVATVTVVWDSADTLHQGAAAVLDDLTVTAHQVHG